MLGDVGVPQRVEQHEAVIDTEGVEMVPCYGAAPVGGCSHVPHQVSSVEVTAENRAAGELRQWCRQFWD